MKKILLPGILAILFLFQSSGSQAVPLDLPYQILVTTVAFNSVEISTTNFPSVTSSVNNNVALNQWCIEHVAVSAASAATFTMAWSTATLNSRTTDYMVVISSGVPFVDSWDAKSPYCAPDGYPVLTLKSSVSGSTITAQGYLWKGWNP